MRHRVEYFVEGVWNPEDIVDLPGTSWIVVSGMRSARRPGCLFVVDGARVNIASKLQWELASEVARMGPGIFDPHGIAARRLDEGRFELLVVDHGGGEAIDRLVLELRDATPSLSPAIAWCNRPARRPMPLPTCLTAASS